METYYSPKFEYGAPPKVGHISQKNSQYYASVPNL